MIDTLKSAGIVTVAGVCFGLGVFFGIFMVALSMGVY